jgi:hypothetical protein
MEKIDADSVDDCTDESVVEFLKSTQERDASVTAEFVKAEVLAKVTFAVSEKDPACSAARTNIVFTNSYVDNNSCLISE